MTITNAQVTALRVAAWERHNRVRPGRNNVRGAVYTVLPSTIEGLVQAGLLVRSTGTYATLTENGRSALTTS